MTSYYIDTNFYLRLLLNDVPSLSKKASDYFVKAKQGEIEFVFLTEILIEMAHVLRVVYKVDRIAIGQIFLDLVNTPYIVIPDRIIVRDMAILYAHTKLDLLDLLLIVKSQQDGKEVLSFDKHIASIVL